MVLQRTQERPGPHQEEEETRSIFNYPPVEREPTVCYAGSDAETVMDRRGDDLPPSQPCLPTQTLAIRTRPLSQQQGVDKSRDIHTRLDRLTEVCGIVSPATGLHPMKKVSKAQGASYHCPSCDSNYTRPRTVKDHFLSCIRKYGNPLGLKYTDHPSMVKAEENRQRRIERSNQGQDAGLDAEEEDEQLEELEDEEVGRREAWLNQQYDDLSYTQSPRR